MSDRASEVVPLLGEPTNAVWVTKLPALMWTGRGSSARVYPIGNSAPMAMGALCTR